MAGEGELPGWLGRLMRETFFATCGAHEGIRKNEKNVFCLHCCTSICQHCTPAHPSHPLLQVRRYVYNDVVRLEDLKQFIDCSYVQPYTINSAKVIFLKPRPKTRSSKSTVNLCLTCERILQEPFYYCCITCKAEHVVLRGIDISTILFRFDESSEFTLDQFENLGMEDEAPSSAMKDCKESSNGSSTDEKSEESETKSMNRSPSRRRKGAPHRSPFS